MADEFRKHPVSGEVVADDGTPLAKVVNDGNGNFVPNGVAAEGEESVENETPEEPGDEKSGDKTE